MPEPVRFGLVVDDDNGHHVRLRVFAATGGQHLGLCGSLVMAPAEYAAFRRLLEPQLIDRPEPALSFVSLADVPHDVEIVKDRDGTRIGRDLDRLEWWWFLSWGEYAGEPQTAEELDGYGPFTPIKHFQGSAPDGESA